ncbi:MAG: glutamyl-tRNA reductase [Candidatus Omnitrophica bacterium]|nr:glutamyl-tRNA reductase [Candidatus Omnitrophota bacterium]
MKLVLIGTSHKRAPLAMREKFSFSGEKLGQYYARLKSYPDVREAFILSTCNRVEIYGVGQDAVVVADQLKKFLREVHGMNSASWEEHFYNKTNKDALEHLLRVASGLDSMVIGEPEIIGQIRKAYDQACMAGVIGSYLHKALQDCLQVGKKVRSSTGISRGVTSVSGVVVELLKKQSNLKDKKVLVIGAGKIGAMTVVKLADLLIGEIIVMNRDMTRMADFEHITNMRPAEFCALKDEILIADIVIAATASMKYLLDRDLIKEAFLTRKNDLLLVDLGVPRNIDETTRQITGVTLYNIDDLAPIVDETMRYRTQEAEKAEEIIQGKLAFM